MDVNNFFVPGLESLDWATRISRELVIEGTPPISKAEAPIPLYGDKGYMAKAGAQLRDEILPKGPEEFAKMAPLAKGQVDS